jgi:hypothetical protein
MYAYSGARQAIQKLIDECDMKIVPEELRVEIKDDSIKAVVPSETA